MHAALLLTAALLADAAPARPPAQVVTEISLERNCFGCPTGSVLVLRRDGTATYTVTGNARHGTEDRVSTGSIGGKDFEALAALLVARDFFSLKDEYADPQTADGPWASVAVVRDGQEKKVLDRGEVGPAALRDVVKAIEAVKARLTFTPSPSGP